MLIIFGNSKIKGQRRCLMCSLLSWKCVKNIELKLYSQTFIQIECRKMDTAKIEQINVITKFEEMDLSVSYNTYITYHVMLS